MQVVAPQPDESGSEEKPSESWRVSYGRRVGQRVIEAGVVLENETDRGKAQAAYLAKIQEFLPYGSIRAATNREGSYCRDGRSGATFTLC